MHVDIYIERDRDKEICLCICMCIYIYLSYIHTHICIYHIYHGLRKVKKFNKKPYFC